jgi:hypothetical protein
MPGGTPIIPVSIAVKDETPSILEHIERYLGPIQESWSSLPDGEVCPFQVVRYSGRVEDIAVFSMLGLSAAAAIAEAGGTGGCLRQELLMAVPETFGKRNVPTLAQQLGMIALKRERPVARGEIVAGKNPLFPRRPFRGFYASPPCVIAEDAFEVCTREDGRKVGFLWMVPVYQREMDFVRQHGFSRLEELIIERELDLVDVDRKSAVK